MMVRAKMYGQYKGRMQETGSVFQIKNSELEYWMEKVSDNDSAPLPPPVPVNVKPGIVERIFHGSDK